MWELFDPYILFFYSITGIEALDGLAGTFHLALAASVIGEFTISVVFRLNRSHLDRLNSDLAKYGSLSREAERRGDEASYRALNKKANDAYGQVFFNRFGLSAASLWPAFFALDWLQLHFGKTGVVLPFFSSGANYVPAFLFCYIAARTVFGRLKRHLPYFREQYAMLLSYEKESRAVAEEREYPPLKERKIVKAGE
ncbi:MAG: hypothetical protein LLG06_12305 [Desulfobacteraceae bacterium]|nr:hypothetical protein [Desulfobacteraceae bacterium]